ncbi:MAG: DUF4190 domain-containing protein [Actinomycetota bacterium]|jgi:hypothetical protein|nr:DUF4190 domain-containing protein [Actinomycetota bacterium]
MSDVPSGNEPWSSPAPGQPPPNQPPPGYGGQGGYGAAGGDGGPGGHGGQPQAQARNGVGIAALVVGIVALVLSWIPFLGLLLAIVAVVLGIVGIRKASRGMATNKGMAIAGLVTGGVALLIGAFFTITVVGLFSSEEFQNLFECTQQAQTAEERQACQEQFQQDFSQ